MWAAGREKQKVVLVNKSACGFFEMTEKCVGTFCMYYTYPFIQHAGTVCGAWNIYVYMFE